jgi:Icc-related predicted phosphoesterase
MPEPHQDLPLHAVVITDLHYLSPELFSLESASFQRMLATNDAKLIEGMPDLLAEFKEAMIQTRPEAVLFAGDLTMNGEMISLLEVRQALLEIQEAGIPVLVIPGNHDIAYPYAVNVKQDTPYRAQMISQKEFTELMAVFGYAQAVSRAPDSFSYAYALRKNLWIVTADTNTEARPGAVTEATLAWLEEVLRTAQEQGIHVITMTHHNLLKQNRLFYKGFLTANAEEVVKVLMKYGVKLNLSGHSHLQHICEEHGFIDICTESAAVWPVGWNELTVNDSQVMLERIESSCCDQEQAKERINDWIAAQLRKELSSLLQDPKLVEQLTDFGVELGREYYTGRLKEVRSFAGSEAWANWVALKGNSFWRIYLSEIFREFL